MALSESPIPVHPKFNGHIDHATLEGAYDLVSAEPRGKATHLMRETTAFPEKWHGELIQASHRRSILLASAENGRFEEDLSAVPGLEIVGQGLTYELGIEENAGLYDMPGVGKRRAYRIIRHNDMQDAPTFVVQFPGHSHTHRYFDATWYLHFLAQIAHKKKCNFLVVNPTGRGVPGYDGARGVGGIGRKKMESDTRHTSMQILERLKEEHGLDEVNVITSGHSLGARLAHALAKELLRHRDRNFYLRGNINECGFSSNTLGDISTRRYRASMVWPFLLDVLKKALLPSQTGLDYTMADMVRIFQNQFGITENRIIAGFGLQLDSARNGLELTFSAGDIKDFIETLKAAMETGDMQHEELGLGAQFIIAEEDRIFDQTQVHGTINKIRDSILGNTVIELHIRKICGAPHCFIIPIPDLELMKNVQFMLEQTYGVKLKKPSVTTVELQSQ